MITVLFHPFIYFLDSHAFLNASKPSLGYSSSSCPLSFPWPLGQHASHLALSSPDVQTISILTPAFSLDALSDSLMYPFLILSLPVTPLIPVRIFLSAKYNVFFSIFFSGVAHSLNNTAGFTNALHLAIQLPCHSTSLAPGCVFPISTERSAAFPHPISSPLSKCHCPLPNAAFTVLCICFKKNIPFVSSSCSPYIHTFTSGPSIPFMRPFMRIASFVLLSLPLAGLKLFPRPSLALSLVAVDHMFCP